MVSELAILYIIPDILSSELAILCPACSLRLFSLPESCKSRSRSVPNLAGAVPTGSLGVKQAAARHGDRYEPNMIMEINKESDGKPADLGLRNFSDSG